MTKYNTNIINNYANLNSINGSNIINYKYIKKKKTKNTSKLLTILIYSLSIIIVMYPISDEHIFCLEEQ